MAHVWIPEQYVSSFFKNGVIKVSNLPYFHAIEGAANGIKDVNDGNQLNLTNATVNFVNRPDIDQNIYAPTVYQGPCANDVFIYSLSKPIRHPEFWADMVADKRRCIQIYDLVKFVSRFKWAAKLNFGKAEILYRGVTYEIRNNNTMYGFREQPTPISFAFSKPKEFEKQNEIRIAIFAKGSHLKNTRNFSYEFVQESRILELGALDDLCEDITDDL